MGIGLVFVLILIVAYVKLKVEQDPKVEAVLDVLPGVNCGDCGLAGCGAYAEAVVADHGLNQFRIFFLKPLTELQGHCLGGISEG